MHDKCTMVGGCQGGGWQGLQGVERGLQGLQGMHLQVCGCARKVICSEVQAGQVEDGIQDPVLVHWAAAQHTPHCHKLFLYIHKMPAQHEDSIFYEGGGGG